MCAVGYDDPLMRKAIIFTGAVLALTALIPASAQGNANGTERPIKVTFSDTSVFDLATLTFHYEGTQLDSHLGKAAFEGDGSISLTGFNTFDQRDAWVVTAANGDELFGTNAATGTGGPRGLVGGSEETVIQTITGGTGRFRDATGTLTGTFRNVLVSLVGGVATYSVHGSSAGTISY